MCVRSTQESILDGFKAQGSPCPRCGKRTRLNAGMVNEYYHRADAVHYATEYNEENNPEGLHSAGEQTAEQSAEERGEEND